MSSPDLSERARHLLGMTLLWLAVLVSAILVVYSNHLCRKLYADMAVLEREKNVYQVEWGRYLLEQSTWASLGRVEKLAKSEFGMRVPEIDEVVIVE